MKNFYNLKSMKYSLSRMKIIKNYKREWEDITKTKSLDKDAAIMQADRLFKDKKYISSLMALKKSKYSFFEPKEVKSKEKEIKEFIKNELILKRYMIFKKYISLGEDISKYYRSFLFSLLLFSVFFYLSMGSPKDVIEQVINYIKGNTDSMEVEETKQKKSKWNDRPFSLNGLYQNQQKNFKFAKNLSERLVDVKGIDEVREEVEEIVKMLKNPEKYENAGAKLIRGILLIGKPGTGKTLLARALAGESGVNFIYVSASEFDKGLVGMGNKLLKNLFTQARANKPCIIFIDEIDTLLHSGRRQG
jgi:ATP-dependent Zn protease